MIDISTLIDTKRKQESADYIMQLQLSQAANNRVMEQEQYKDFIRNLTKDLEENGPNQASDKLDRHALEALRLMTNQGANKTGGG